MELLIIGMVVAFNFIIVKMKLDRKRWEDAVFDILILFVIAMLFKGSYAGLVVGAIASLCISLYFFASPPTFFSGKEGFLQDFLKRVQRTNKNDR